MRAGGIGAMEGLVGLKEGGGGVGFGAGGAVEAADRL